VRKDTSLLVTEKLLLLHRLQSAAVELRAFLEATTGAGDGTARRHWPRRKQGRHVPLEKAKDI